MPKSQEDLRFVELACQGDIGAFGRLQSQYEFSIYEYIVGLVGKNDAFDLTQDTFVKAFVNISHLRDPLRFKPWLYRIARNCVIDYLRQKHRNSQQSLEELLEINVIFVDYDLAEHIARKELVQIALGQLPPKHRECLLLFTVGGLSAREIAELVDLTEQSVTVYVYNARKQFRKAYQSLEHEVGTTIQKEVKSDEHL